MAEGVRRSRRTERDEWLVQFERWDLGKQEIALELADYIHGKAKREAKSEARRAAGSAGAPPPAKPPADDDNDESGEGADIDDAVAAARVKLTAQGLLSETADRRS